MAVREADLAITQISQIQEPQRMRRAQRTTGTRLAADACPPQAGTRCLLRRSSFGYEG